MNLTKLLNRGNIMVKRINLFCSLPSVDITLIDILLLF